VDVLGHRLVALTADARAVSADLRGRRTSRPAAATLIPYFAWCHRGTGEMQVWFPTGDEHAEPASDLAFTASHCHEADSLAALHDGLLPKNSGDHDIPRMTWWPRKGTAEWVHVDLKNLEKVTGCSVYWFDDTGRGGCRLPVSWTVQIPDGQGGWTDVPGLYPVAKDRLCEILFQAPVSVRALRLRAVLQPGFSGGVLEWRLDVE
jgi:hypothetical protein